ncbi:phosphatase PAP2 family protein [Halobacteria archaeon AArc-dxtr1]|nr:phosphatase PAP2 family protein [Halobacteria archaeon AArc-dxtr1]
MQRDLGVMVSLRETLPSWLVDLLAVVSLAGDLVVILPLLGMLVLADGGVTLRRARATGRHDGALWAARTMTLVAVVFGGLALIVLVKSLLALPRPPATYHAIEPSEHGFPSGHTMAATVFWGALAWWWAGGGLSGATASGRLDWRARLQTIRWPVAGAITLLVALVGLSRLALGVHYLPDVLTAVVLGVAYLAAMAWLARDRPAVAFAITLAIAAGAVLASGASSRAVLALGGTVVTIVGWQLLESPPVRGRLLGVAA